MSRDGIVLDYFFIFVNYLNKEMASYLVFNTCSIFIFIGVVLMDFIIC